MGVIWFYLLFALTTAIAAHYELIAPVMREFALRNPEDNLVKHKWLSHGVMFLVGILVAPVLIFPTLIPSVGEAFRSVLVESLAG
jgi:hypothetical protein